MAPETDPTIKVATDDAGDDVELPLEEVLTGRAFITGKSGSGKSNSASVVVEEILDAGHSTLIVDTDGEYFGLKEQYEVLHAGADDQADIQVGPEHAERLATLALEERVPIILDVSGYLDDDVADELVRETARHLFALEKDLRRPFLLVVEECHEYIPEGGGLNETGQMLIKVAKRGRKHGLGVLGISQRPADVKKDFITQCDWLVWHRLTWDNDTDVVRRVVSKAAADAIEDFADGEAWLQSDFLDEDLQRVQFRRKTTFDAGDTPGLEATEQPELKSLDENLLEDLEEISAREERRRDRVAELEDRLDEKDDRIEELEQELQNARDVSQAANQLAQALQQGGDAGDAGVPEDFEEQLRAKNDRIADLEAAVDDLEDELSVVIDERDQLADEVDRLQGIEERVEEAERVEDELADIESWVASAPPALRRMAARTEDFFDDVSGDVEADVPDSVDVQALRERVDELEAERDRLRDRLDEAGGIHVPSDYREFVDDEVVQEQIRSAFEDGNASEDYARAVIGALLEDGDAVTVDDVLGFPDISSKGHVSRAVNALEERRVIVEDDGEIAMNVEGIEEVKRARKRREERKEVMEAL